MRSATLSLVSNITALLANVLAADETARPKVNHEIKEALNLTNGTGANQIDRVVGDSNRNLVAAASETIDLFDWAGFDIGAGAGLDALGQAIQLAEVVLIAIVNKSAAGFLDVGGDDTAAAFKAPFVGSVATPEKAAIRIGPGGMLLLVAPADPAYAVVDATDHLLKIAASGADVDYSILVAGRSA